MAWPPQFIPAKIVLDNYRVAFEFKSIFWYMKNSLIISIGSVFISMVVGGIAALFIQKYIVSGLTFGAVK